GKPWTLLNSGALAASAGRIYLTNPELRSEGGTIVSQALGLVLGRHIDGGMHEDIDITNHGAAPARFDLALNIGGDFADLFEVKGNTVTKRGKTVTDWQPTEQALTTRYRNKDFSRAFRVMAKNPGSPMSLANGKLQFAIELEPGEKWHSCLLYDFADGDTWSKAPLLCVAEYQASDAAKKQKSWRASVVKVE